MLVFEEIESIRAFLTSQGRHQKSIGFVPTMGALHQGHLELIRQCRSENDITVCSIFVNPAQFNNPEDFKKYPNTIDKDRELLQEASCDALFLPSASVMYPSQSLSFQLGQLASVFEGEFRPGHFAGVALVVSKLFNIVQPNLAYFGQKDFQQVMVIQKLVKDLNFPVKLKVVPTIRESDGLAMSSRNLRLSADQRARALVLFRALRMAKEALQNGESFSTVHPKVKALCDSTPEVKLEYIALANAENLNPINNVGEATQAVLLIAAYVGDVRLIDNVIIHEN